MIPTLSFIFSFCLCLALHIKQSKRVPFDSSPASTNFTINNSQNGNISTLNRTDRKSTKQAPMASIKVFGSPASTEVARVLACLLEKDVDFQLIRIDTYKGEHKIPEFIKLQDPSGQVTYKEGEKTLLESREICRHISDKYKNQGNKRLIGTGTLERASIEQWLQAEERNFDPPSSALVFHLAFAPFMNRIPEQGLIDLQERKLARVLDIYEDKLGETEFLAGDDFTLADLSHLPNSHYLVTRTARGHKLFESRKNVSRWWESISSRPSWKMVAQMQGQHPGPLEKH